MKKKLLVTALIGFSSVGMMGMKEDPVKELTVEQLKKEERIIKLYKMDGKMAEVKFSYKNLGDDALKNIVEKKLISDISLGSMIPRTVMEKYVIPYIFKKAENVVPTDLGFLFIHGEAEFNDKVGTVEWKDLKELNDYMTALMYLKMANLKEDFDKLFKATQAKFEQDDKGMPPIYFYRKSGDKWQVLMAVDGDKQMPFTMKTLGSDLGSKFLLFFVDLFVGLSTRSVVPGADQGKILEEEATRMSGKMVNLFFGEVPWDTAKNLIILSPSAEPINKNQFVWVDCNDKNKRELKEDEALLADDAHGRIMMNLLVRALKSLA